MSHGSAYIVLWCVAYYTYNTHTTTEQDLFPLFFLSPGARCSASAGKMNSGHACAPSILMRWTSVRASTLPMNSKRHHPRLRQFILGPVLSGAHFHFHGSAWNGLVFGLKLWVLVPPHAAFCAALHPLQWIVEFTNDFNAFGSRRDSTSSTSSGGSGNTTGTTGTTGNTLPLLVLQRPGEIVFVPEGWGHAVLNLADSIGVATEFWPILR